MKFAKGASGNPGGRPKGQPHLLTARVRKMVEKDGAAIVEEIIKDAKNSDPTARQLFCRFLLPRPRLNLTPIDLPEAQEVGELRAQISKLASLAAGGALDLDSMTAIARVLAMALGARMEELEEILETREAESDHDNPG